MFSGSAYPLYKNALQTCNRLFTKARKADFYAFFTFPPLIFSLSLPNNAQDASRDKTLGEVPVDIIYLVVIAVFFTALVGLAWGCAKLGDQT